MREFQGKRLIKSILYSRLFVFLLFLLVALTAHSVWKIWQKSRIVVADREAMASQVAALDAREAALRAQVAALQTERGQEAAIREKFSVIKEGEGVVTVVAPPEVTVTASSSRSWWQKLLEFGR